MSEDERLAEVIRLEGAALLASLVRWVGDLSVAEEAVQEAALAALADWPRRGVPDVPRAWLTTTARRKAVDLLRRERARTGKERASVELAGLTGRSGLSGAAAAAEPDTVLADDLLRLLFTCAHPSLAAEAQLTLALRTLCQLSVPEVAAVLLTGEAAVAKRLTRTRQKIAVAAIPYRVPTDEELPGRLPVVCSVVHALYTAGHAPRGGPDLVRVDLCAEGVRLARLLVGLLPDEPLPAALLALLLLTEARRPARVGPDGEPVLLADQDRTRWDHAMVADGGRLLAGSLRRTDGVADPYQLQAAIAWEHARAPGYREMDWAEVVRLYDLLLSVAPSAPAALARAVAVAERDGPVAGLAALDALPSTARLEAVRAELLARQQRYAEAVVATDRALAGTLTHPERRHEERRRTAWLGAARATTGSCSCP